MISWKRNIPDQFECLGINNVNQVRASFGVVAATFHVVILVHRIEYCAVHGRGKLDLIEDAVVFPTHQFNHPEAVPVGDDKIIGLGKKNNRVGLSESLDTLNACTGHKIENLDGLLILGCEE